MFPYQVITNFDQAEEYRENLDLSGEEYLQKIDKLVTTDFPEGEPVYIDKIVKPANLERFWMAFTYILLALGKDIAISDDHLTVKILQAAPNRQLFSIPA